jgi:hypothetical protein
MTVAELIAELQKWPGDRKVCFNSGEYPYCCPVERIVTYPETGERFPWCDVHGFLMQTKVRNSVMRGEVCLLCHPWGTIIDLDKPIHRIQFRNKPVPEAERDVVLE